MTIRRPHVATRIGLAAVAAVAITTVTEVDSSNHRVEAIDLSPSGPGVPSGNLDGWRHVYSDDFPTNVALGEFPAKVSQKWGAYKDGWRDTTKKGTYMPSKVVSVRDGVLNKYLHSADGKHYVSALTPKVPGTAKYGQMYGRYSVRMRADKIPGYKIAWMLWPDKGSVTSGSASGVGGNGEIDFPETDLTRDYVFGFVHRQNATVGSDQAWFRKDDHDISKWHTYTIEWSPGLVVLYLDGVELGRTRERIPNTAMHWVLQTETSIRDSTPNSAKGNVQIDWVSAWQYDPNARAASTTPPPPPPPPPAPAPAPAPKPAPSGVATDIWVSWPADGATVDGGSPLKFDGRRTDITAVKWYVDRKERAYDGRGPTFSDVWNTNVVSNGKHTVFAKARLSSGVWITSRTRTFTVAN